MQNVSDLYFAAARYVLPAAAVLFMIFASKALLKTRKSAVIARLYTPDKSEYFDITANESVIGSSALCDIRIKNTQSRQAVISKCENGFELTPIGSRVSVDSVLITDSVLLRPGSVINFGDNPFSFAINAKKQNVVPEKSKDTLAALVFLLLFQLLAFTYFLLKYYDTMLVTVAVTAAVIAACEIIYIAAKRCSGSVSTVLFGFFLSTIGIMTAGSAGGKNFVKIAVCAALGFAAFAVFGFILKSPRFCRKLRVPVGIAACALMLYNGFFGTYINGAKNWIYIGDSISFQPSELVKVVFIFCSAALMNELVKRKNLYWFAFLTLFFCFCLALMRDFGTASIYFVTALIIVSMRTKSRITIFTLLGLALIGGIVIINVMPHVSARFAIYGKVWDYAYEGGYQQTRTMIAIASGGLFGLGGANGNLIYISAADTDLVFGVVSEEWGLIIAVCAAACYAVLLITCIKCIPLGASSFYSVSGCAAAGLYLFQASLNIFGSVDILPLTGVPLPFISNGGSAMMASWLLLAFVFAYRRSCERSEYVE